MSKNDARASRVVELTPDNFDEYVNSNRNTFVLYTIPWSRECKQAERTFDALSISQSKKIHADVITIAKVNAKKHPTLAKRMRIQGYPTLMYYTPEEPHGMEYNGLREVVLLDSFLFQFT